MNNVFVKKDTTPQHGFEVGVILNRKETKGQVGIEIEIEGTRLPHEDETPSPWQYHSDGSLRGKDNGEYVLARPVMFDAVPEALKKLWDVFATKKTTFDESMRTSVHVHLNCQTFHLNRLTAFMALYFTFEEVLTEWCGEHRVGNLFCLRAKDAPAIISQIRRFIKTDGRAELRDSLHYSGLNANALHKFGSLEVRSLRGCSDPKTILDWVGILERFYTLSAEFEDPREICSLFSAEGPLAFFENVLGDKAHLVRSGISYGPDQIADAMYDGIRLAQDLCYCRDWSVFKAMKLSRDPFGRDPRKIVKKLAAGANGTGSQGHVSLEETYGVPSATAPMPSLSGTFSQYMAQQAMQTMQANHPGHQAPPPVFTPDPFDTPDWN